MPRNQLRLSIGTLIIAAVFGCRADDSVPARYVEPPQLDDASILERRQAAQFATADQITAFHDFSFSDHVVRTGITFEHRVVEDAAKTYKAVHYDHGNGVSVADVDGDGRLDIYFVSQVGSNELWRNKGDGTFEDITERAGVGLPDATAITASFADIDNDGDPDLYVTIVRDGNRLFLNDGTGRFEDATRSSGLGYRGHPSAAVFLDYDRDGLLDLFLTAVGRYTSDSLRAADGYVFYNGLADAFFGHLHEDRFETNRMYRNLGGAQFLDVTDEVGLRDESFSGDATPIDLDGDGWQDLYVLDMQGDDEYFENRQGTFAHRTDDVFPVTPWGSMGVKAFDADRDGRLELLVTDMHSDMSRPQDAGSEKRKADVRYPLEFLDNGGLSNSIYGNALFRRTEAGSYEDISDSVGVETYWPWGISTGDLNADGYTDVFVAGSMNFPFRYGVNSILLNEGDGGFADAEFLVGVEPRANDRRSQPWFTVDCTGEGEAGGPLEKYCLTNEGLVEVWGSVGTRSSAIFDIEGDGDLDIVTNEFGGPPMILVSDLSQATEVNYLEVDLIGTASNRDGLGAEVKLVTAEGAQIQVKDGVSGYLSHSLQPLYFGLGTAASVERLEVRWPSGLRQVVEGPISANRSLVIREGADPGTPGD